MKQLILKKKPRDNKPPDATDFTPDFYRVDGAILIDAAKAGGYVIDELTALQIWSAYSETYYAGWLTLNGLEHDHLKILLEFSDVVDVEKIQAETTQSIRGRLISMAHDPNRNESERQELIKEIDARFAHYSFRAEGVGDVVNYCHTLHHLAMERREHFGALQIKTDTEGFHECRVEFRSTLGMETLRDVLRKQIDSHVMLETLRPVPLAENSLDRDSSVSQYTLSDFVFPFSP